MTTWNRVQGDVDDSIVVTLNGIADLSAVDTLEAHVWRGDTRETLDAEIADSAARTVLVHLGDETGWLATAEPGYWRFEVQATFGIGTVLTWPADEPDRIYVRAQGDDTGS